MRVRNEVKAGVVIFVAIVILVIGIFVVGDFATMLRGSKAIYIMFDDVGGLKVDDPVYACGVKVGRVKDIRFCASPGKDGKEYTRVLVEAAVTDVVVVREGYSITVDKTLTAITSVVIVPGSGKPVQASRQQPLKGASPTNISDVAAKLSDQATELAQQLLEKIGVVGEQVSGILTGVSGLLDDVRKIVGDEALRENIQVAFERIRQSTEEIKQMTESATAMIEENRESVKATIAGIRDSAQNFNATLSENREKISSILTKLDKTSDTLDSTLAKLGEAGDKASSLVSENKENIQKMVENLKKTTATAKTTVEMVKRQPWRLLYKPQPSELETANLYDSAYQFNEGAAAVNEAAADLLLLMSQSEGKVDNVYMQRTVDKLEASLTKYEQAEKEFWRCLGTAYQR